VTHNATTLAGTRHKARAMRLLCSCLLVAALVPVAARAQYKAVPPVPTASITPVSHDSVTIAGEPELYLSTPELSVNNDSEAPDWQAVTVAASARLANRLAVASIAEQISALVQEFVGSSRQPFAARRAG
jgi:hypothetical protein